MNDVATKKTRIRLSNEEIDVQEETLEAVLETYVSKMKKEAVSTGEFAAQISKIWLGELNKNPDHKRMIARIYPADDAVRRALIFGSCASLNKIWRRTGKGTFCTVTRGITAAFYPRDMEPKQAAPKANAPKNSVSFPGLNTIQAVSRENAIKRYRKKQAESARTNMLGREAVELGFRFGATLAVLGFDLETSEFEINENLKASVLLAFNNGLENGLSWAVNQEADFKTDAELLSMDPPTRGKKKSNGSDEESDSDEDEAEEHEESEEPSEVEESEEQEDLDEEAEAEDEDEEETEFDRQLEKAPRIKQGNQELVLKPKSSSSKPAASKATASKARKKLASQANRETRLFLISALESFGSQGRSCFVLRSLLGSELTLSKPTHLNKRS